MRQGEKIESFSRKGPKPVIWGRDSEEKAVNVLKNVLEDNEEHKLTTAVITKDLASAKKGS